jgi:hypothetical protein
MSGAQVVNKTFKGSLQQFANGVGQVFKKDSKLGGEVVAHAGKVNILERVAGKPFRMIGRHPRLAMGAAVVGGVAWMHGQHEEKQKLAELEFQAQQAQQMQSYKNTVSPAEWQDAQSQFRTTGQQGGFAGRVTAEREAAAAQQPAVQGA